MMEQAGYRLVSILFVMLFVVVCVMPAAAAVTAEKSETTSRLYRTTSGDRGTQEYIVGFRSELAMKRYLKANDLKTSLKREWNRLDMILLELTPKEAKELSRQRDILFVEENHEVWLFDAARGMNMADWGKNGRYPDFSGVQYQGIVPSEEFQYGVRMMGAEEYYRKGFTGKGVKVGVIDSGIDYNHPDLHVAGGKSFRSGDTNYKDVLFHGTHVAGIIAAQHNGFGVPSPALKDACARAHEAGILLVASAGNSGRGDYNTVGYPARYDSVIAVSAIDSSGEIASWSSRGPEVELAAPGVEVLSTITYPWMYEHLYDYLSGTSMASPHVVGLAALIKEANPGISPDELRRRLSAYATDLGTPGRDRDYGFGIPQPDRPASVPDNQAPDADAGGPYRGIPGEPVTLSAAGSLDPDDNFLSFAWDFGDGTAGSGITTTHTYRSPGDYSVSVAVTDREGKTGTARATVAIRAGVVHTLTLSTADLGQASPAAVQLKRTVVTAGVQRSARTYGMVLFSPGSQEDLFVLSSELHLTGKGKKPTSLEGTVRAGLLPDTVAGNWPAFGYADVNQAATVPLEPDLPISPLGGTLGTGIVNRFRVPSGSLEAFEGQMQKGALAFRITYDSARATNS
ncbi:MAG: hypothetical protein H6R30_490, partial [Methanomicrobia archaeon]|nr:hypothetical protein [Methanomicrobia archaeon]